MSLVARFEEQLAVILLLAATVFVGNDSPSLWDQDEAVYAGFARNMARRLAMRCQADEFGNESAALAAP